ncbi:apoptosis-associated speck-like protein containing a CARD isoform X2 [Hoplias malabaricus]|uniref:apoptosis-associated speck-like protein containing a CARD isoform X2 n=1 Tax=Hoplias malabaricus TaxID=27720 RepID=UPI003462B4EA
MSKTQWDLLFEALEDLDDEQFKKFTLKLTDSGLQPPVRRGAVQGKDRGDIARKLIDTYTEERALGICVQLLEKIGCMQTARDLEKEAAGGGSSSSAPPKGGAAGAAAPSNDFSEATFIDNNWTQLVARATSVDPILDELRSKNVITPQQYNEIRTEAGPNRVMRALITGPIMSSESAKKVFYQVLMEQQPYMMQDLGAVSKK